jgi:hypothetical protein
LDIFNPADNPLIELDFRYSKQILAALLPMALTVVFHSLGITAVHRFFIRFGRPVMKGPHHAARTIVIICVVGILLISHFYEVVVWAAFYYLSGLIGDVSHAMSYSINSYTTLGASGITLGKGWLGFGNFESMTAMLMFGWSTAVLANIINKFHNIDD